MKRLAPLLFLLAITPAFASDTPKLAYRPVQHQMKTWQKVTLGVVAGLVVGAVLQHQRDDDRIVVRKSKSCQRPPDCHGADCQRP